ncbi:hypothetical protein [Streptomyces sp. MST-110588]|nr:hypothetical protein [Streptomyces sp. MST-110588]
MSVPVTAAAMAITSVVIVACTVAGAGATEPFERPGAIGTGGPH